MAVLTRAAPPPGGWITAAVRALAAVVLRQGLVKVAGIAGTVVLARILYPRDFGVFAVVSAIVGFLALATDIGLGGALIQQEDEPGDEDVQAVFTFQLLLVLASGAAIFVLAPPAASIFHLAPGSVWLIRALALLLAIDCFRTVSGILLRRRLQYARLAIVDVASAVLYQVAAVTLALMGAGAWALAAAALISYALAAVLLLRLAPWPVRLRWDWVRVRRQLRFGLPYQGAVVLADLELAAGPVLAGALAGSAGAGYVMLTYTIVNLPVAFPQLLLEVAFPAMARLQRDAAGLSTSFRLMAKATAYSVGPAYLMLLLFGPQIVTVVLGPRWSAIAPLLALMSWSWLVRILTNPLFSLLNSVGRSAAVLWFHVWSTGASWLLAAALIPRLGIAGIGWASLAAVLPLPAAVLLARRSARLYLVRSAVLPLAPFAGLLAAGEGVAAVVPAARLGHLALAGEMVAVGVVYLGLVALVERRAMTLLPRATRSLLPARARALS